MKVIFDSISSFFSIHGSKILLGIGIAGFILTPILAIRAFKKLKGKESDEWDSYSTNEKFRKIIKHIWPSILVGTIALTSIIGSYTMNLKQLTQTTTALIGAESALSSVLSGTATEAGKVVVDAAAGAVSDVASDIIRDEKSTDKTVIQTEDKIPSNVTVNTYVAANADILCYDGWSGRPFMSTMNKIDKAVNECNEVLNREDYVSLNEFYNSIGLDNIDCGCDQGWERSQGLIRIHYDTDVDSVGNPRLVLRFVEKPTYIY